MKYSCPKHCLMPGKRCLSHTAISWGIMLSSRDVSSVRPAQGCSSFKKSLTEGRQKFLMNLSPSAQDRTVEQCLRDLGAGAEGYPCICPGQGTVQQLVAVLTPSLALKPFIHVLGGVSIFLLHPLLIWFISNPAACCQ